MLDVLTLPAAIAIAGLGMMLFALIRRVMRAPNAPGWLANDVTAYAVALLLTGYLALSMMATAVPLMLLLGSAFHAGLASIAVHIALWMIARLIIPLGTTGHGDTLTPPTAHVA